MAALSFTTGEQGHEIEIWEQAARQALAFIGDESLETVDEQLTDAQFQFLSFLYRSDTRSNVYDLSKAFKDAEKEGFAKTRLSLATAYRAADSLEERGLIEEVDSALSSKNKIRMPIYGITERGRHVLRSEIVRTMKFSLSGLVPATAGK